MVDQSIGDEAALADLADLLDYYEPLIEADHQNTRTAALLQDSDRLLAETEALLLTTNDSSGTIQSVHSLTDHQKQSKNTQAANRRLKYRNKLKTERDTLDDQEKTLSEELKHLLRARKRVKSLWDKNSPMPVWKAIATRQKEGRLVAEEQQRRLKSAVENRAKVIEEISNMMRERVYGSKSTKSLEMVKKSSVQLTVDDTVLSEEFLNDLDVIYSRTDKVFQSCEAEENPIMSYRLGPERKRDGGVEYIDNLNVLLIPFSFEQTCDTMWQSMIRLYRQRDWYHYDVADPENTLAVKSQCRVSRESGEVVYMFVHFVMRRYLEAERMILVWRALSEGEGEFTGIHSDETGWCVVRPNDSDEPLLRTIMQTFVRFIPMDITNTPNDTVDGYQFT